MTAFELIGSIAELFQIDGELVAAAPYGHGHINDTFLAVYRRGEHESRMIHQRINGQVFPDPDALMSNFALITSHLASKIRGIGFADPERRVLRLVPGRDGRYFAMDKQGEFWRTTYFIEGTITYDVVKNANIAYEIGRSFGEFQSLLSDLSPERLQTTIADFHNTPARLESLWMAIGRDPVNRGRFSEEEIEFVAARESSIHRLNGLVADGSIPTRIAHNDTKANNLLIDISTEKGICVTDLDTTMPGLAFHDFGDMVRTVTNQAAEDEVVLERVSMQMPLFRHLAQGYLRNADQLLNTVEKENLVPACKLITLETGMRFLTDYLEGDRYFKTQRPAQNLDRCRVQFKLLQSMEDQEELMQETLYSLNPKDNR